MRSRRSMQIALAVLFVVSLADRAEAQNWKLKPAFGEVKLKTGFEPDPFKKELVAGGNIQTNLGGVKAFVADAPDFRLIYQAGDKFNLTIAAVSKADTTLLVNLPSEKFVANDDGGQGTNPLLYFPKPQSGQYDIWVGTFEKENAKALLVITELFKPKMGAAPSSRVRHLVSLPAVDPAQRDFRFARVPFMPRRPVVISLNRVVSLDSDQ